MHSSDQTSTAGPVSRTDGGTRAAVSAVLIVQDEAGRVAAAVRSCQSFADEVLVVDGGSRDATVEICRELGCRVLVNPWPGFAAQRAFAIAAATSDWIFVLDADEVVGDELGQEILTVLADDPDADAFRVTRIGDFLGRWVGPDYQVRLCRRSTARVSEDLVHEHLVVPPERLQVLDGVLWHYGFRSVSDHVKRFNHYTDLEAQSRLANRGHFSLTRLLLRPPAHFALEFLGRGLYRRGLPGLFVAMFWSLYDMLIEVKVYEGRWRAESAGASPVHEPPRQPR